MLGSSSPLAPEDFKVPQDLLPHVTSFLGTQAEFLQENTHKLVDVLQPFAPGRVTLPINNALLEPAEVLWSMLT